jgi:Xaa-Pro aminopeptidase
MPAMQASSPFALEELDLARMRRERHARLQAEMASQGAGAMLLLGGANVSYATGALTLAAEEGRASHERACALVVAGADAPHLFTPFPEGAPPEARVHPPLYPELEEGVADAARRVLEALGGTPAGALAVDEYTAAMLAGFAGHLPGVRLSDAGAIVRAAKLLKTADEIECIRRAQRINEIAMEEARAACRPGARQSDLSGIFLRRIFEVGATANSVDPIWQVMPGRIADGPYTTNGDVAFPLVTSDRILRDGDVVWVDSGVLYHGYASDFGRTWVVGDPPRVSATQRDQFRRWRDIVRATLEVTKPGATGRDLTRAAIEANGGKKPWLAHFYLAHGLGTESAEMPLIGTDLGDDFDAAIALAPGMVFVLEPVVWDDGECGYRSEEIVAVTDDGHRVLTDHPYTPFE